MKQKTPINVVTITVAIAAPDEPNNGISNKFKITLITPDAIAKNKLTFTFFIIQITFQYKLSIEYTK